MLSLYDSFNLREHTCGTELGKNRILKSTERGVKHMDHLCFKTHSNLKIRITITNELKCIYSLACMITQTSDKSCSKTLPLESEHPTGC